MKYLLKQIGLYLVTLWVSLTINFILPRLMPGDPVTALMARMRGRLNPAEIWSALAGEVVWVGILLMVYLALWRAGLKRYSAVGA